jgi:hypothetical protein
VSLTLTLSDEQASALKAKAAAEGLSLDAWIEKLSHHEPQPVTPKPRPHISEVIQEIMSDVPREVFETLPHDGASEHDHYLYGTPKKNQ